MQVALEVALEVALAEALREALKMPSLGLLEDSRVPYRCFRNVKVATDFIHSVGCKDLNFDYQ